MTTTDTIAQPASGGPASAPTPSATTGSVMTRALQSEWTKLRSVRSTVWALLLTSAFTIGLGVLFCEAFVHRPADRRGLRNAIDFDPTRRSLGGVVLAMLAIGVLGVLVMSSEFTTGMIRTSAAAVPQRRRLLAAKAIVLGVVCAAVSIPSTLIAFLVGQAVLSSAHVSTTLSAPHVLRAVLCAGLFLTMIALFGLAIGTIVRRTPGALATLFGLVLIFPLLAQALPSPWDSDVGKLSPLLAGQSMYAVHTDSTDLSSRGGFLMLLAWVVAAFVIATISLSARDV